MAQINTKHVEPDDTWHDALPETIPESTYWPAVMSFGIMLLAWSVLGNWPMACAAIVIIVISVVGWVRELYND